MNLTWRVPPDQLLDEVEMARVTKTMALLDLQDGVAIDSYVMAPDGPLLSSVFLVSEGLLIEVALTSTELEFDLASADNLINYRVRFGELVQSQAAAPATPATADMQSAEQARGGTEPPAPPPPKRTRFAEFKFRHTDEMVSSLGFFGDNVDAWVSFVLKAYSPVLLVGRKSA